jgi:two-component system sensor histidine kinase DegS
VATPTRGPAVAEIAARLDAEAKAIQAELEEIDLLVGQARTEAARHEGRRAATADKLVALAGGASPEIADLATQLIAIARKAALMEAQIDVLEGKRKSIDRLGEVLRSHAEQVAALGDGGSSSPGGNGSAAPRAGGAGDGEGGAGGAGEVIPPGVARLVLSAQEDLRREIARQMHDGPAQSLTNIVLQAQIVEHLLARDPAEAEREVHALTAMVQRTLDATKTFIFDVRPMVLDDLGLVPTLRRAARDRGARAGVKVEFESAGVDRRLPAELESGLFRMLDDALAAQLAGGPERVTLRLDWGDSLVVELAATKATVHVANLDLPPEGQELPPALAEMVEDRKVAHAVAVEAARRASVSRLPDRVWREIAERSGLLGLEAELLDEGARLRLSVPLPA